MPEKATDYAMFRKDTAMISLSGPVELGEGDKKKVRMFLTGALHSKTLNKLDWDKRISVSLDQNDCGKLLYGLRYQEDVDLYHQYPDKPSKVVKLSFKDAKVSLSISQGKQGDADNSFVFANLQTSEFMVMDVLLEHGIKKIIGWT